MPTGNELLFVMSLNAKDFLNGTVHAQKRYEEVKDKIEKKPIEFKEKGLKKMLEMAAKVTAAWYALSGTLEKASKQIEMEKKLADTLKVTNQYSEERIKILKEEAAEIQKVTTLGDEMVLQAMIQAANYGIAADELTETVKKAIGLTEKFAEAGLTLEQALKAIAEATQGSYGPFEEFIPQLRNIENETEKIALIQKAMVEGLELAQAKAETTVGKMEQLKNVFGDLQEVIGTLLLDILKPLVEILKPIIEGFNSLSPTVRNAILGFSALIIILIKIPPLFSAIRASLIGLYASMGPGGWLIAGLSILIPLIVSFSSETDKAARSTQKLERSFERLVKAVRSLYEGRPLEELLSAQKRLTDLVKESREEVKSLYEAQKRGEKDVTQQMIIEAEKRYKDRKERLEAIEQIIKERQQKVSEYFAGMTEKQIIELDKRKEYEFQTNRLSLADYISYLQQRGEWLKKRYGEDSLEVIKFYDKLRELENQYFAEQLTKGQKKAGTDIQLGKDPLSEIEYYKKLFDVESQFYEESNIALEEAYSTKKFMIESNLANIALIYGEESDLYKQELQKRLQLDEEYNNKKIELTARGVEAAVALGSQLIYAYQGQSEAMFNVGKGLAIADVLIKAYQASARAFADYPFPISVAVAGATFALAAANVSKILSVDFKPGGKALGGLVTYSDLARSPLTPAGEDGIIGIQAGEFVVNRESTQKYRPLLEAINQSKSSDSGAFASGGEVSPGNTLDLKEAFKEALDESKLEIEGETKVDGMDIYITFKRAEQRVKRNSIG